MTGQREEARDCLSATMGEDLQMTLLQCLQGGEPKVCTRREGKVKEVSHSLVDRLAHNVFVFDNNAELL